MSRPSFALVVLLSSLFGSLLMTGSASSQIGDQESYTNRHGLVPCPLAQEYYGCDYGMCSYVEAMRPAKSAKIQWTESPSCDATDAEQSDGCLGAQPVGTLTAATTEEAATVEAATAPQTPAAAAPETPEATVAGSYPTPKENYCNYEPWMSGCEHEYIPVDEDGSYEFTYDYDLVGNATSSERPSAAAAPAMQLVSDQPAVLEPHDDAGETAGHAGSFVTGYDWNYDSVVYGVDPPVAGAALPESVPLPIGPTVPTGPVVESLAHSSQPEVPPSPLNAIRADDTPTRIVAGMRDVATNIWRADRSMLRHLVGLGHEFTAHSLYDAGVIQTWQYLAFHMRAFEDHVYSYGWASVARRVETEPDAQFDSGFWHGLE